MTLTELKYILAVAQEKNFGRAADKCFVSQPTLSIAIKKLEEELEVAIFERQKNEVLVTPVGEKIIAQAQRVQDEAAEIKSIAKEGQDQLTAVLKLGAIYTVAPYLFPSLLPKLKKAAPDMPLMIQEDYTKNLSKKLIQGELDIIIVAKPYEQPGVMTTPLFSENLFVIISPEHPWKKYDSISPDMLKDESVLLLGQSHCFRADVLRACPDCGINSNAEAEEEKMVEGGSLETIRHMVASGMGISVLPESAINPDQYADDYLVIKPFTQPQPTRDIVMAYRQGYPREQVLNLIKNCFA